AGVEPEARGDTAAAAGTVQRRAVVWMLSRRLDRLRHADARIDRTVGAARALAGGVLCAKLQWIDLQLLADLVHDGLRRKGGVGRSRGAVRRRRRLVDADIVAVNLDVGDVVTGKHAHGAGTDRRTGIGAGLVSEGRLPRGEPAALVGAELDSNERAGRRAGA